MVNVRYIKAMRVVENYLGFLGLPALSVYAVSVTTNLRMKGPPTRQDGWPSLHDFVAVFWEDPWLFSIA